MDQGQIDLILKDSSNSEAYLNYIILIINIYTYFTVIFITIKHILLLLLLMFILSSLASACKLFKAKLLSKLVGVFNKSLKESEDGNVGNIELSSTFNEHKRTKFKSNICDSAIGVIIGD